VPPRIEGNTSSNESSKEDGGTILSEFRRTNSPEFRDTHPPIIPAMGRGHIIA